MSHYRELRELWIHRHEQINKLEQGPWLLRRPVELSATANGKGTQGREPHGSETPEF